MQNYTKSTNFKEFYNKRRKKQIILSFFFLSSLILGWIYPIFGFCIPVCVIFGIGIGAFKGRKWCDWYCPRGSFWDTIVGPISAGKEIPSFLKNYYLRFGIMIFLFGMMILQILTKFPDLNTIGRFFIILLTSTTIIGILLGILFHKRSWCSICPVGLAANLAGKNKCLLSIESASCKECKACAKVCPADIKPYIHKTEGTKIVKEPDCYKCESCINACPNKALNFSK